jgi:hypothetical protein
LVLRTGEDVGFESNIEERKGWRKERGRNGKKEMERKKRKGKERKGKRI